MTRKEGAKQINEQMVFRANWDLVQMDMYPYANME